MYILQQLWKNEKDMPNLPVCISAKAQMQTFQQAAERFTNIHLDAFINTKLVFTTISIFFLYEQ